VARRVGKILLTNDNIDDFFSLPTDRTSAVVAGTNPYNFIKYNTNSETLLVTIGDSWTWGDDLHDDHTVRLNYVYGGTVSGVMKADFLNLGEPGAGNWHIARKIKELAKISSDLDYKQIIVISIFTEVGRDFDSDDDRHIDYRSWLIDNINTYRDYYSFLKFINEHIADAIHSQLAKFDQRYSFYFGTNFVDAIGMDKLKPYFFDKSWLEVICDRRGVPKDTNMCYLVSPWIIEKLQIAQDLAPELGKNVWLHWANELADTANDRAEMCKNDQENFLELMHPSIKCHGFFAEYVLRKINNFYEVKLENDRLLEVDKFVSFCHHSENQNIVLQINNEAHCLTYCGVYDILDQFTHKSVIIKTSNRLETHDKYQVESVSWLDWMQNLSGFDQARRRDWNQNKIFGCFYGRPSAPRLGIATHLARNHSAISYIQHKFNFDNFDSRNLFDIQRLFSWDPESVQYLNLLRDPKYHSDIDYKKGYYDWTNTLVDLYDNILIDLVAEPVSQGLSFYPTEKIWRPILARRPFIVMGSRDYLEYLRQMGFETFNDFWDEDYDGYDGAYRYYKILDLINKLASQPLRNFTEIYKSMTKKLQHNYDMLINQSYATNIKKI
jgi:hypothetical protein